MNWASAKNILICVFVILNIFLFFNLRSYYRTDNNMSQYIKSTEKILKERGYILDCNIPKNSDKSASINYQEGQIDKKAILEKLLGHMDISSDVLKNTKEFTKGSKSITFNNNVFEFIDNDPKEKLNLSDKSETEKFVITYLKNLNLGVTDFYLDELYVNPDKTLTYSFYEDYKGYLLYISQITIMVSKNGVNDITCGLAEVNSLNLTNTKIVPAYLILLKNFTHGNHSVIKNIDLGFTGKYLAEKTEFSENAVWRVKMADGTQKHFSIINGQAVD